MKLGPREHESQLTAGEGALDHLEGVDAYFRLPLSVASVEVRVPVVVEEHRNHDPVEAADRRHAAMIGRRPDANLLRLLDRRVCDTVGAMLHPATTRTA